MSRFNSVNIYKETEKLFDTIFDCCDSTSKSKYGGFREDGFNNIDSKFFTFVFLCGGNKKEYSSRRLLDTILRKNANIKIIVSEDLESYKGKMDLLTFEATLEAISKMILIPVESYGTACELGAFTRIDNTTNKVVAIMDEKRKKDKSFINYGPIALLKDIGDDRVYYAKYSQKNGVSNLLSNSEINQLYNHKLIVSETNIIRFFGKDDNEKTIITDLKSFFVSILDLICLLGFINVDIILRFFNRRFASTDYYVKSNTISCNHSLINDIVYTFLKVLESVGFLKESDGLYYVDPCKIAEDVKQEERWIGRVLFTKRFLSTDEYLTIKTQAILLKNKIIRYGYF